MLLSEAFQDESNKILLQQSMNVRFFLSHNWIQQITLKNRVPKHTYFGHVLEFLGRMMSWCKRMYSVIYDIMKSYLTHAWDKKICNGYVTW